MIVFLVILGVLLVVLQIAMIIKFFQMAKGVKLLSDFIIYRIKPVYDVENEEIHYYAKMYLDGTGKRISKEEWQKEHKQALEEWSYSAKANKVNVPPTINGCV